MPALLLISSASPLPWLPVVSRRFFNSTHADSPSFAARVKVFSLPHFFKASSPRIFIETGALNHSFCAVLAFGLCAIEVLFPLQPALAESFDRLTQSMPPSSATAPYLRNLNLHSEQESVADKVAVAVAPSIETPSMADGTVLSSMSTNPKDASSSDLFQVSLSQAEQPQRFLDYARVFSPAKAASLLNDIDTLEAEARWRLRVITKTGSAPSISGKDLKDLWKPDERTVIVIEDISSPNILNFNAGADVIAKLPRQFFLELQSRYGNQFFVQQEGEGAALTLTVKAIRECLQRPEGCKNVPGLTDDLYYLTLATSIVGGCVFGFAARLPPSGRVEASWQWVLFLSPLWLLLFASFGILPVVGRTSELEPLVKNTLGFAVGAFALYLTPIFGPSPISKK
ncbi:hypothetical protein GOP47_0010796 [Adiantum capillus-veneris]|uniref:TPM domain-containing protein n=1 Tax=Adiantum capillus-veneris TaxID=13818 RepID=A0A9D4UV83_ADICA|nr:hypothetical protein GOP47_0010796 [Adiantum capillus-veneris]